MRPELLQKAKLMTEPGSPRDCIWHTAIALKAKCLEGNGSQAEEALYESILDWYWKRPMYR